MEARRSFVGAKSYRQLWIILAALLVAAMLAVGAAFMTSGALGAKAPAGVHPAPGTVLHQDNYRTVTTVDQDRESNPGNQSVKKSKQTVF